MLKFWESPDFVLPVLFLGTLMIGPFGYLSYTTAKRSGMDLVAVLLSVVGGLILAFIAAALLVSFIWLICYYRSSAVKEIQEFLPNYRPISFKERAFRYFDFREF